MSLTSDWAQDVQNAGENKTWNDSGAGKEESTQGWDELPSSSNAPDRDGRSWNQSEDQESLTLLPTSRPIGVYNKELPKISDLNYMKIQCIFFKRS